MAMPEKLNCQNAVDHLDSGDMRVLVVEDQKKIASFIRKGLEEEGMVVDVCLDGDEGYELACSEPNRLLTPRIRSAGAGSRLLAVKTWILARRR